MKNNFKYTHELICDDIKYYVDDYDFTDKINNYFEMIYDINKVYISGMIPAIRVHGKVHLYGFKVEDGGFFDIINNEYYDERNKLIKNGEIIPKNDNIISSNNECVKSNNSKKLKK